MVSFTQRKPFKQLQKLPLFFLFLKNAVGNSGCEEPFKMLCWHRLLQFMDLESIFLQRKDFSCSKILLKAKLQAVCGMSWDTGARPDLSHGRRTEELTLKALCSSSEHCKGGGGVSASLPHCSHQWKQPWGSYFALFSGFLLFVFNWCPLQKTFYEEQYCICHWNSICTFPRKC